MSNSYASKWEQYYARYLDALLAAGDILAWYYEPVKFNLAPRTTYSPDFLLVHKDKSLEFVEVKGRQREDAMVKYKVAAGMFPCFAWRMVRRTTSGAWEDIPGYTFAAHVEPVRNIPRPDHPARVARPHPKSYEQMQRDPSLAPILAMRAPDLHDLRHRLCISMHEMAAKLDLDIKAYSNLERGVTKLYHYRHVMAIKELQESLK